MSQRTNEGSNAGASMPATMAQDGAVAIVTLDSPKTRNALSSAMLAALSGRFAELARRRDIRAIVLQAEGPVFCAGHDLKELTAHRGDADCGRAFFDETMQACSRMMQQIVAQPQPVIAAVDGMATAAGCQLVATCDLAVAGPQARFCTPGVNIGLFCSTPAVALSRAIPRKQAMEMLLTGDVFDAEDALRFGLVNRHAPEGARGAAMMLAQKIAAKSAQAVAIGKRIFYRQAEMSLANAYDEASAAMVANMLQSDAREGIGAFLEKRAPVWDDGEAL